MASSSTFSEAALLVLAVAAVYAAVFAVQKRRPGLAARLGLKVEGGVVLYRTEALNAAISRIASRHARAIRLLGDASALAGLGLMAYGLLFLHENLLNLWSRPEAASPVSPVIPGVTVGLESLPYFAAAVFLAVAPHELAHALTAAAEGLRLKSTGLFLAAVFPGGFAEIDEEQLEKSSLRSKLRVLSAGSFANILVFLVLAVLTPALVYPVGVRVAATLPGYPAESVLKPGDVILRVNGTETRTLGDFTGALASAKPGDSVVLTVSRDGAVLNATVTLAARPDNASRGFLGVQIQQAMNSEQLYALLYWCLVVSSSVAVLNMLPILPLDGGRVFKALLERLLPARAARLAAVASTAYCALVVALNIALSSRIYGLVPLP